MSRMITLSAYDCVEVDGYLYFFSSDYNLFFKSEISTGKISIIGSIPEENIFTGQLCSKLIHYKNFIYFAPMHAGKIWRYCIDDRSWKNYEFPKMEYFRGIYAFCQVVLYNDKLFFFGCRYPAIVILNLNTEDMTLCESVYTEHLRALSENMMKAFFVREGVCLNDYMYMASCLDNTVLKFNMNNFEYEYVSLGDDKSNFSGIGYDGSNFYIAPRNKNDAIKWDGAGKYEVIKLQYLTSEADRVSVGVLCDEGKVYFYGMYEDRFLDSDNGICILHDKYRIYKRLDTGSFVCLDSKGKLTVKRNDEEYIYFLRIDEDYLNDYLINIAFF